MECKGTVTKVDAYYGYIEVDNKFTIYLGVLKGYNETLNLPVIGTKIKATNLHKYATSYVACGTTVLKGDFSIEYQPNFLTHLIKKYELGVSDLIVVNKILKLLQTNLTFQNNEIQELVTGCLFETLIKMQEKVPQAKECCLNNVISHLDVMSISSCRFVEVETEKFTDFPTWTFGVHSKIKRNSLLFGFMFINHHYGFLMLKDAFHKILCIVTNKESNIDHFENSYVLIKYYTVITEVFKESKVPNLEYLIVKSRDIVVVHSLERNVLFGKKPPVTEFKYKKDFILYRKSTVCLGPNDKTETYLEVLLNNDENKNMEKIFLILPFHYTSIILYLQEGYKYNLYHNCSLNESNRPFLKAIETLKNFILEEQQAYFQELDHAGNPDIYKIVPITERNKYMSMNLGLLCFEGIITSRGFAKNLYNEAFQKVKVYGFTTPGIEIHTVAFSNDMNDGLIIYLSNWIKRLMPIGLVPDMRVIVKNVLANSKYIKPTVFTSFEIVAYEPKVPFQTVNLFEYSDYDWGSRYYLSLGNKIPQGVIVWSKIQNIHIVEVKMSNRCKNCEILIEVAGPCLYCDSVDRDFQFKLVMYTSDEFGRSRVFVQNLNFLRLILDVPEQQFSVWLKAFENVGNYYFSIYEPDSRVFKLPVTSRNLFINTLTILLEKFNKSVSDCFEIKCRKKYPDIKKLQKIICPQWIYLDGRKISF